MGYVSFTMSTELKKNENTIETLKAKLPAAFGYHDYIDSLAGIPDELEEFVESEDSEEEINEDNTS